MREQANRRINEKLAWGGCTSSQQTWYTSYAPLNEEAAGLYAAGGGRWLAHLGRGAFSGYSHLEEASMLNNFFIH